MQSIRFWLNLISVKVMSWDHYQNIQGSIVCIQYWLGRDIETKIIIWISGIRKVRRLSPEGFILFFLKSDNTLFTFNICILSVKLLLINSNYIKTKFFKQKLTNYMKVLLKSIAVAPVISFPSKPLRMKLLMLSLATNVERFSVNPDWLL